ncbi:hypothetical protein EM868_09145 [Cupriavidus gilardii]|uniref:hypothetical protein n=1 Tax=Cupriavidus gilardii TaxID=82541 RepID=UPI001EE5082D|nr:hypothetical protein [Cupriavidus gilardii]MCG5259779.1 hypothetical protein [Cupriavidus gilardii]MDF9429962.1 hypothetical protein [Cupriavidus gilardii]
MTTIKADHPAFPTRFANQAGENVFGLAGDVVAPHAVQHYHGLTVRQYAAIHLRIPDSGTAWLDDMIRKAQRDEFAAKAMQSILSNSDLVRQYVESAARGIANDAHEMADAMVAARESK